MEHNKQHQQQVKQEGPYGPHHQIPPPPQGMMPPPVGGMGHPPMLPPQPPHMYLQPPQFGGGFPGFPPGPGVPPPMMPPGPPGMMAGGMPGLPHMMQQPPLPHKLLQDKEYLDHLKELNTKLAKIRDEIERMPKNDLEKFKDQKLPLARIKKIMKSDEDVRMISAEAPILFAKACEMFIIEMTHKAYYYASKNNRKTLQRNDISAAIVDTEIYDFLLDTIPNEHVPKEIKETKMTNYQRNLLIDVKRMRGIELEKDDLEYLSSQQQQQQAMLVGMQQPPIQQPPMMSLTNNPNGQEDQNNEGNAKDEESKERTAKTTNKRV